MIQLRDYQQVAVDGVRNAFIQGKRAPLLVAPTGAGKTVIFSYIAANASARGNRVLVLVHRVELVSQTSSKLMENGVRHGIINPDFTPDITAPVQVASVQTLVRRIDKYPAAFWDFSLIIIDEAHHAVGKNMWGQILRHCDKSLQLGVTATPVRGDGKGLGLTSGGYFDELVLGPSTGELIQRGFLVKPVVYGPAHKLDLTGVRTKGGDYDSAELEKRVDKPSITGDAVAHYNRICPGAPCVVFCTTRLHAQHVAAEFRSAGYRAYAVDGTMDKELRKRILAGLGNGTVDVVTSVDVISEGTDVPAIGCAILLRPTKSEGLYIQQVGRALRLSPGKDKAFILDHVGNVLEHGLPEAEREWSLEGEKKKRKKKDDEEKPLAIKQCPKCYGIHEPAPICPHCGFAYVVKVTRGPEQHDGELREITDAEKEKLLKSRERKVEIGRARTREELEKIAAKYGYKPGWVTKMLEVRGVKSNEPVNLPSPI